MNKPSLPQSNLNTVLLLFVTLRLTLLLLYKPQGLLNAYTDYHHYYRTAQLSEQGYLPYINSWSEYPPLLNYTTQFAYTLTRLVVPVGDVQSFTYELFARLLGVLMLIFECGILILLHHIANHIWGQERANWLGWVYSSLSVPLFYWNASQTSNFVFFTLLAVYAWLKQKPSLSAVALALGALIKLTPIFFLAAILKFTWPNYRSLLRYGLIFSLIFAIAFLPFLLIGSSKWVTTSLTSNLFRASWATPWALLDGNWGEGFVGDIPTRTQIELASQSYGNPVRISSLLILVVFTLIYLALSRRAIAPHNPKHLIWFTTLMLLIFHLWSKGWSPQWATLIIPFLLLSFPNQKGLTLVLILSGLVFIEWPIAAILQPPTNGIGAVIYAFVIWSRTLLFLGVSIMLYQNLWRQQPHHVDTI